jgi:hypothetical protein
MGARASASSNGKTLQASLGASDSSDSEEESVSDSDSDADSGSELPIWTRLEAPATGTCPLCLGRRPLPWSTYDRLTDKDVAVCGRCHSYNERNDRTLLF